MTDTPNQHSAPTPVNQKLTNCPACGKDILAKVYLTLQAGADVDHHAKSFTMTANVVGLSVAHDCIPRITRGYERP